MWSTTDPRRLECDWAAAARSLPGAREVDERRDGRYPTSATESARADAVFVRRIRADISRPRGLNPRVVSDNVRGGAALDSVQIAETLVKDFH